MQQRVTQAYAQLHVQSDENPVKKVHITIYEDGEGGIAIEEDLEEDAVPPVAPPGQNPVQERERTAVMFQRLTAEIRALRRDQAVTQTQLQELRRTMARNMNNLNQSMVRISAAPGRRFVNRPGQADQQQAPPSRMSDH